MASVKSQRTYNDITGLRIGNLVAESVSHSTGNGVAWNWMCDCGEIRIGTKNQVSATQHCGCRETANRIAGATTHGQHKSRAYTIWVNMRRRCNDPKATAYNRYGGRGIRVCERWATSFDAFLADMGHPPDTMTLDRIDNNGDYEPGNCRWATRETQSSNQSNNVIVVVGGERLTQHAACIKFGLAGSSVRLAKSRGMSAQQAIEYVLNIKAKKAKVHHS